MSTTVFIGAGPCRGVQTLVACPVVVLLVDVDQGQPGVLRPELRYPGHKVEAVHDPMLVDQVILQTLLLLEGHAVEEANNCFQGF